MFCVDSLTYRQFLHTGGIEFSAEFSILITSGSRAMLGLRLHTEVWTDDNEKEQEKESVRVRERESVCVKEREAERESLSQRRFPSDSLLVELTEN